MKLRKPQKKLFFNGSAIKALTPSSLIAVAPLAVGNKSYFFPNGTVFTPPPP